MSRSGFEQFEAAPLGRVLEAIGRALGRDPSTLRPGDRLEPTEALERELAALGLEADLPRLPTVRRLVGAVVPLLERRPRAHH